MRLQKSPASAVVLLSLLLSAEGAWDWLPKWGKCPQVEVEQDFAPRLLNGVWYEQAGYRTDQINRLGDNNRCVTAEYSYEQSKTGLISIINKGIDNKSQHSKVVKGTARLDNPLNQEGRLTTAMHSKWFKNQEGRYWVLSTDYTTYLLVYSCDDFLSFWRYESVWELSRFQVFTSTEMYDFFGNTTAAINSHNLSPLLSYITPSEQERCSGAAEELHDLGDH